MSERRVNEEIGARLKRHRAAHGLSRALLGESLGVSAQQIQKYENGSNRIPAARLAVIAGLLGRQVQDFYGEGAGRLDASDDPPALDRLRRRQKIARTVERLETMPEGLRAQILALIRSAAPDEASNRAG